MEVVVVMMTAAEEGFHAFIFVLLSRLPMILPQMERPREWPQIRKQLEWTTL